VDETLLNQLKNPWFTYFIKFNPATYLTQVKTCFSYQWRLRFSSAAKDNLAAQKKFFNQGKK
jgi:hypothetical protein